MSNKDTAVAEAANTAVSTNVSQPHFDAEDIDIPRINLVQKMSQIDAPTGAVVLDKTHVLAEAETPIDVTIVAAQKGWRENIPFDEEDVPRIAWSKEQSDAIEMDSDYDMIEFAEITLLVKQPEDNDDDEAYPFPIGDSNYAMGKINVSKNAYRSTFKRLATFAAFNKSVPLNSRTWTLTSEVLSKGKYTWHNPSLSITKNGTDDAVTEFLNNFGS